MSVNKVILVGSIGREPGISYLSAMAAVMVKRSGCAISDGFPEAGGGGAAAVADGDTEATGGEGAPTVSGDDDDDGGDGDGDPDRRPRRNARRKAAPLPAPGVQPATTATISPLLKLPQVLASVPVSRSSWYAGMRSGLYPAPVKLGPKSVAWRRSDIDRLIETLAYSN